MRCQAMRRQTFVLRLLFADMKWADMTWADMTWADELWA